jgi:hypothetical protein
MCINPTRTGTGAVTAQEIQEHQTTPTPLMGLQGGADDDCLEVPGGRKILNPSNLPIFLIGFDEGL